jgi:HPt (histidine-containing phosphotransfer) domain-containing protein
MSTVEDDGRDLLLDESALNKVRQIGGDDLLGRLIDSFLKHAPARVVAARAGEQAGDLGEVERATHSLKSTAGNLGARRLQYLAERIESLSAAQDPAAVTALLGDMETVFEATRVALVRKREGLVP